MSTILRLYSIVHAAMGTTKTSNFTCQSKSFISIFSFTFQVSAFELQPLSCHVLANDIYQEPITPAYTHKLPKLCSVTLPVICLSRMGAGSNRVSKWFLAEFPRHCSKKFYLDRKKNNWHLHNFHLPVRRNQTIPWGPQVFSYCRWLCNLTHRFGEVCILVVGKKLSLKSTCLQFLLSKSVKGLNPGVGCSKQG